MKKVILITGASSGIGNATLKKLLSEGHIVYGSARKVDEMNAIREMGGIPIKLDMTQYETLSACVNKVIDEQGRIDVLFNNAGFGLYGSVEETSIDDAKYQFDVNLFGLARLTQLVLPHMRKQGSGTIINTSSMGGRVYTPLGSWYHATKHALEGWSDCLRLEVAQFNIKVVIVEPGAIETNFGEVLVAPLLKRSGNGPYKKLAESVATATKEIYGNKDATSPASMIADVVSDAIKADNPKTRYIAGKMARLLLFVRKYLGDRIYDKIIMSQLK